MLLLVIVCFMLSGFAALLYQTAWMRLFAVAFGTSEIAVAVVLSGYMAGLAIGSAIAAKFVGRIRRPVLVYGFLEGAIAIAALSLPLFVVISGDLYAYLVGNQPAPPDASTFGQPLYYSIAAFVVLLIPTALMGATLPLLAQYAVTSNRNLGSRVSLLYSMNTFGAVGGTLVAGFILLPALGLRGTVWVGVVTNGIVFLLAVILAHRLSHEKIAAATNRDQEQTSDNASLSGSNLVLPLIALSGALSFVYEVLWTRMLSHVLGSSVYAFATMLSAFLTGIALGAAAAGLLAKSPRRAIFLFAISQFGIAIASAFVYSSIEQSVPSGVSYAVFAFAVILPSSIFIGATYPFAVRAHAAGVKAAGRSSALVYSWNTVGAIVGALAGGFLIIPGLGFAGTAQFAVIGNLCIGIVALLSVTRIRLRQSQAWLRLAAATALAVAIVIGFQPERPDTLVKRAHFGGSGEQEVQEIHYAVGRSSTVLMTENPARFDLSTNGLPEAQIEFKGAPPSVLSQRWLGIWPSLVRPDAESMLVVGLGGGVVLEGVPKSINTLHVVELEAEVVAANRLIGDRRSTNPLARDGLHLVVNDARNALRLTSAKYDAVVSQPSHPWTAGASHLFTQEFFALVKRRLNDDGVFVQWMNAEFLDEVLLKKLAATLLSQFENVRIYQPSSLALHFIASNGPIDIEHQLSATGRPIQDDSWHYASNGISGAADLIAALLVDENGVRSLAEKMEPITDDDNRMAVDSDVLALGLDVPQLFSITAGFDPLLDPDSELRRSLIDADFAPIARRLLWDGQVPRVRALRDSLSRQSSRDLLQAMLHRYEGNITAMHSALDRIGSSEPVFDQAQFLRVIDDLVNDVVATSLRDATLKELQIMASEHYRFAPVARGWIAQHRGDWLQVKTLERELQATPVNDLWAPQATQLRAAWRLQVDDPDQHLAREALQLLDRVSASNASINTYAMRADAALKLEDAPVFIESVAFMLNSIDYQISDFDYYGGSFGNSAHKELRARLVEFDAALQAMLAVDQTGRASTVHAQLQQTLGYFGAGQ